MPRHISSIVFDWSSDSGFRVVYAALKNALLGAGLVQTSDTGQVDVATVLKPTANNTDAGYLMFRFADALQSAAPVFIRVTLGSGGTAATRIRVTFRVGTGTDGAGNLTGLVGTLTAIEPASNVVSAGAVLPVYATHSGGAFALCFLPGVISATTYGAPTLVVQRTCDNIGSPTADGVVSLFGTGSAAAGTAGTAEHMQFLPSMEVVSARGDCMGLLPWVTTRPTHVGLSPQIFNHFVMTPKCLPLVGSAGARRTETTLGQVFPLTLVGTVPRTYMSFGQYAGNVLTGAGTTTPSDLIVLWED